MHAEWSLLKTEAFVSYVNSDLEYKHTFLAQPRLKWEVLSPAHTLYFYDLYLVSHGFIKFGAQLTYAAQSKKLKCKIIKCGGTVA